MENKVRVNLPANVQEAMRENLSGHVSAILREELETGAEAINALALCKAHNEALDAKLREHGTIGHAKSELTKREKACAEKEKSLEEQAKKQSIELLIVKLDSERQISSRLESILAGLVRNTEWREQVHEYEACYNTSNNGVDHSETKAPKNISKEAT